MNRPVHEIFRIEYPKTAIFSEQEISTDKSGIPFVSSSGANNGVVGYVLANPDNKLYKGGAITVPLKGSVLEAFYQPRSFYIAHQIAVLYPKRPMIEEEFLFYALCFKKNKFKFNYGRQADRTFKDLLIPADFPEKFKKLKIKKPTTDSFVQNKFSLLGRKWEWFIYDNLFEIKKGKRLTKEEMKDGETPFVGSSELRNGITAYVDKKPIHNGNTISVTYNGSVGEAFYQQKDFYASDDVNVLYPKFDLNPHIALFLVSLIRKEKYRFSYGRKWHLERMKESKIKLPVDKNGNPDWQFMEDYIKSLPYSASI